MLLFAITGDAVIGSENDPEFFVLFYCYMAV
jgi:hypothetical protein